MTRCSQQRAEFISGSACIGKGLAMRGGMTRVSINHYPQKRPLEPLKMSKAHGSQHSNVKYKVRHRFTHCTKEKRSKRPTIRREPQSSRQASTMKFPSLLLLALIAAAFASPTPRPLKKCPRNPVRSCNNKQLVALKCPCVLSGIEIGHCEFSEAFGEPVCSR